MRRRVSAALAGVALIALAASGLGLRTSGAGEPERADISTTQAEMSALREAYRRVDEAVYPPENPYSPAKAALGQHLFFDTLLSGERSMSCASCHVPTQSWSDGRPRGIGETGAAMKVRTPTLLDVAQIPILGWDGKFRDLESVAFTPITSASAMNLTEATLLARLRAAPAYVRAFAGAFPERAAAGAPEEAISRRTVELALATFQRSIVSGEAPFDRWVEGDETAIPPAAQRGFALFTGKAGCAACHTGWNFTDNRFHDLGLPTGDLGRAAFEPDSVLARHAFKTPGLRNLTYRAPFGHAGQFADLEAILAFYETGGLARPSKSPLMKPLQLAPEERADLIAFLRSLTAEQTRTALPNLPN